MEKQLTSGENAKTSINAFDREPLTSSRAPFPFQRNERPPSRLWSALNFSQTSFFIGPPRLFQPRTRNSETPRGERKREFETRIRGARRYESRASNFPFEKKKERRKRRKINARSNDKRETKEALILSDVSYPFRRNTAQGWKIRRRPGVEVNSRGSATQGLTKRHDDDDDDDGAVVSSKRSGA